MHRISGIILFVGTLLFLQSCSNDDLLAKVNDHELTENDAEMLMNNLGYDSKKKEDRTVFVDKWVDAMLMQDEIAESNEKMAKVADFRASLFKGELANYFLAEEQLIKSIDTVATEKELKDYYEKHKNEFELQDFIVKALFIKLPVDAPKNG